MSNISIKAKLDEIGVNIDALESGVVDSFRMSVGNLAKAAQNEWVRRAQQKLSTSREIYINGLRQAESFKASSFGGSDVFEVQLVGAMPNNFEFGMESFDMKGVRPGWLGGSRAKVAKDGSKYVIIPFRHSSSSGSRFAYTGKAKAADLKAELRKAVREYGLDRMMRAATGKVVSGPVARISSKASVHSYLKGLSRIQQPMSGSTSSGKQRGSTQLLTFRIISEKSSPESWIHPGLDAANILPEIQSWVDAQMDKIIETILGVD